MQRFPRFFLLSAASLLAPGCVTEQVSPRRAPDDIPDTLAAGTYHGVTLYFEVAPGDIPEASEWIRTERRLPVIVPEITAGRETYRVRDLHRVDFHHAMFEVGGYRYPRMPKAHLYVYKRREGNLEFVFNRQRIVIPSDRPWVPSVYTYPVDKPGPGGRVQTAQVLQVGLATIETLPEEGAWLVNGKMYFPEPSRPLELTGATHAAVAR